MAPRLNKKHMSKVERDLHGKSSEGIGKDQPNNHCRRSARLHQAYQGSCRETEPKVPLVRDPDVASQRVDRKRKRAGEPEQLLQHPHGRLEKRRQTAPAHANGIEVNRKRRITERCPEPIHGSCSSPQGRSSTRKRLREHEHLSDKPEPKRSRTDKDSSVEYWIFNNEWPYPMENSLETCLARPKPLRRTKSTTSLNAPSEISSRETKTNPYSDKNCETFLESKGSFLDEHENGVSCTSRTYCGNLLNKQYDLPLGTRFGDEAFESTCRRIRKQNESGVIRAIADLIVPSAWGAIDLGCITFPHLIESVNEGWDSSILLNEGPSEMPQSRKFRLPRPQPDYAVGFARRAFNDDQLSKLAPLIGGIGETSFFLGTADMYFPFMTSEVKCGKAALDTADRQNAHTMTLSMRGVVKLFRLANREKELHQEILAFSISHDNRVVRIYGHYCVIEGDKTAYYRHPIRSFDFTELDGRDRWASYRFVLGIYDDWASFHFKRLCSAIDGLAKGVNLQVSHQSEASQQSGLLQIEGESFSESTGLSQGIGGVELQHSSFTSELEESRPALSGSQDGDRVVSATQSNEGRSQRAFKMPKKRRKE